MSFTDDAKAESLFVIPSHVPRRAVYAGTFDPPTNGHQYVIERGARLFDELIVAIAVNPAKTPMFSVEERISLLERIVEPLRNVRVDTLPAKEFTIHYAARKEAQYLLRGVRSAEDYSYEAAISEENRTQAPTIETVTLFPPHELSRTSSSAVKSFLRPDRWEEFVAPHVHPSVLEALRAKRATLYGAKND